MRSPILVASAVQALAPGQTFVIPGGLRNPDREAMLVHEIVVHGLPTAMHPGTDLLLSLRVGRQSITDDFVPVLHAARTKDWFTTGITQNQSGSNNMKPFVHVWRFKKPLYLPNDGSIDVALRMTNVFAIPGPPAYSLTSVGVSMRGLSLGKDAPVPRYVAVPWANSWLSQVYAAGTAVRVESSPGDLRNAHREPLMVDYATVTMLTPGSGSTGPTADDAGLFREAKVRLFMEGGEAGVRDQQVPGALFAAPWRAWNLKATLRPTGYFIADVDYTVPAAYTVGGWQAGIGLVGYRNVAIEELGVRL